MKLAVPLALVVALVLPQPAPAQTLGPMWETRVTLTQADLDMIKSTLAQQIHNRPAGTSASWQNPTSGNSGTVTLLRISSRQGRRCEQIEYRLHPPEKTNPSDRFVLTSCAQPDGGWKLS